jgi:hypothetical protein
LTLGDIDRGYFKVTKVKNRMWRLTGERWIHACYRTPNFIL